MLYCNERREKQAAAKQTFVAKHIEEAPVTRPLIFHKPLTNEPSAEQTVECVSAGFMSKKTPGKQAQEEETNEQ